MPTATARVCHLPYTHTQRHVYLVEPSHIIFTQRATNRQGQQLTAPLCSLHFLSMVFILVCDLSTLHWLFIDSSRHPTPDSSFPHYSLGVCVVCHWSWYYELP